MKKKPLNGCRDCGHLCSHTAKACPACGARRPLRGRFLHGLHQVGNGLIALGLLAMLATCVLGCAS